MACSILRISSAPRTAARLVSFARALAFCALSVELRVPSVMTASESLICESDAACSVALCARLWEAAAVWLEAAEVSLLDVRVVRTTSISGRMIDLRLYQNARAAMRRAVGSIHSSVVRKAADWACAEAT
jgi:hypothetical protein